MQVKQDHNFRKNLKILKNIKLKKFIKKRIKILTYDEINNCSNEVYQNLSVKFNYNEISMIYFTSGSTGNQKVYL